MAKRGGGGTPISLFSFQDIITSVTGIMILVTLMMTLELVQRTQSSPAVQTDHIVAEVRPTVKEIERRIQELEQQLAASQDVIRESAGVDPRRVAARQEDARRAAESIARELPKLEQEKVLAKKRFDKAQQQQRDNEARQRETKTSREEIAKLQEKLAKTKSSNRPIYNPDQSTGKSAWLLELAASQFVAARVGESAKPQVFDAAKPADRVLQLKSWLDARDPDAEYVVLLIRPSAVDTFEAVVKALSAAGLEFGYDLISEQQPIIDPNTGAGAP